MFTDQDYKNLDEVALLDLLADQTSKYTKALVQGAPGHNLNYYRTIINILSDEIRSRQLTKFSKSPETSLYPDSQPSGKG